MLARDGGMNVPNIGQGPGSVITLPRDIASGESTAPNAGAVGRGPAASPVSAPAISFTRLACFDVNGDGSIDTRSAAAGGDATLLVPTHAVDLPTYTRRANPMGGGRPAKNREPAADTPAPGAGAGATARANRAAESYQRYGQAPPVARTPTPVPTPVPAATAAGEAVGRRDYRPLIRPSMPPGPIADSAANWSSICWNWSEPLRSAIARGIAGNA